MSDTDQALPLGTLLHGNWLQRIAPLFRSQLQMANLSKEAEEAAIARGEPEIGRFHQSALSAMSKDDFSLWKTLNELDARLRRVAAHAGVELNTHLLLAGAVPEPRLAGLIDRLSTYNNEQVQAVEHLLMALEAYDDLPAEDLSSPTLQAAIVAVREAHRRGTSLADPKTRQIIAGMRKLLAETGATPEDIQRLLQGVPSEDLTELLKPGPISGGNDKKRNGTDG